METSHVPCPAHHNPICCWCWGVRNFTRSSADKVRLPRREHRNRNQHVLRVLRSYKRHRGPVQNPHRPLVTVRATHIEEGLAGSHSCKEHAPEVAAAHEWADSLSTLQDVRRSVRYFTDANRTDYLTEFVNQESVKRVLGADVNITWEQCDDLVEEKMQVSLEENLARSLLIVLLVSVLVGLPLHICV